MRHVVLIVLMTLVSFCAVAKGTFSTHINEVENGYNFILYEPDSISDAMPLVITLHSRGSSGENIADVDRFGTIDALYSGMELDAIVLAPQATGDRWDVEKVIKDINWVITNRKIDTNRIYAIGMSMGGNGVADLACAYPDRIAAAIVLAGSITTGDVANLNKLPLWVIRGQDDRAESIARTDRMVNEMRSQPDKAPRLVYSKLKGVDHRQHERMLYMPYFYEWLMSHNLENPNRSVNTTVDITPQMLEDAYKGLTLRDCSAAKRTGKNDFTRDRRRTRDDRQRGHRMRR